MGTINKEIADDVIAGKYASDRPVKLVKYQNAFNGHLRLIKRHST